MLSLRIHLLGSPELRRSGSRIPVRRRKAAALLAYLAVTGRSHGRDALTTLLWPETDPVRGHANLRNLLWILKREIAPIELSADYETVGFAEDSVWSDVAEFRERSRTARSADGADADLRPGERETLAGCAALYRDHFLAGFGLRDNYAFEEWQLQEREALRAEFASVLEGLVRYHRKRREWDEAIAFGRRWLALDPFHEPAQREMMDLYTDAGLRSSAIELYDQSARLLEKELGLSPAGETTELRNRILSAGLARIEGAPRAEKPRHNLPARNTRFVGRDGEMEEIRRILGDPDHRLLTLSGPGGSGKTRLAIQAAEERLGEHPEGVFLVPLVSVESPRKIAAAVVEALRVPIPHGSPEEKSGRRRTAPALRRRLIDYLRERRMLLVMDNMEHLTGDLGDLAAILEEAPGVRVIATSRERLRLPGECVLELEGLPFPEEGTDREEYRSFDAVRLFRSAARRANVVFEPDEEDEEAIARICRRLRGGPLGIELAAARTRLFRCAEIDREIEKSLDFLAGRGGDVPERHRSLRAVFDASWEGLTEKERRCFRRLSLFRNGFTREAAAETAGCPLRTLEVLRDKSLLRADPSGRFAIHETLRRFADEKLRENREEREELLDRFASYYLRRLAKLRKAVEGTGQKEALAEVGRETENIRTAWLRGAARGFRQEMARAFFPLFLAMDIRSRFAEGAELFDEAIRILGESDGGDVLSGALLVGRGWFLRYDRIGLSEELVRRGTAILEPFGPSPFLGFARVIASILQPTGGEEEHARLEEALDRFEKEGDRFWAAMTLEVLGYIAAETGRGEALRYGQRSLHLRHALGDRWGIALSHDLLGRIADLREMPRVAKKRYWESVKIRRELGVDLDGAVCIMERIALQSRRTGDFDESFRLLQECVRLSREMGHRWRVASSRTRLGMLAYDMGLREKAREELEAAAGLARELGDRSWLSLIHGVLTNAAFADGESEEARFQLDLAGGEGEDGKETIKNPPLDVRGVRGARNVWLDLGRGRLAAEAGDAEGALRRFRPALRLAAEDKEEPTAREVLVEIARVRFAAGDGVGAGRLLGFLLGEAALTPFARERAEELRRRMARRPKATGLREAMASGREEDYAGTVRRELEERSV